MRVLLLGLTGRVGSRLLPALLAHQHSVVAYARNLNRIPDEMAKRVTTIVEGCGTDANSIKTAILTHHCDAVINAAGRASLLGSGGESANIFAAVTKAAQEAQWERNNRPLRCWLLSGWPILDSPKTGHPILS
jgi:nucleoside-diphosphate-sugar epimerase